MQAGQSQESRKPSNNSTKIKTSQKVKPGTIKAWRANKTLSPWQGCRTERRLGKSQGRDVATHPVQACAGEVRDGFQATCRVWRRVWGEQISALTFTLAGVLTPVNQAHRSAW